MSLNPSVDNGTQVPEACAVMDPDDPLNVVVDFDDVDVHGHEPIAEESVALDQWPLFDLFLEAVDSNCKGFERLKDVYKPG